MNRADFTALRDAVEHGRTDLADRLVSYRVDNAIIMAAGYSARCMPLSEVMPKERMHGCEIFLTSYLKTN